MKIILCVSIFAISANALKSSAKFKTGFDSVYAYTQDITVFIDALQTSQTETKFNLAIRKSSDAKSVVGQLQKLNTRNLTDTQLNELKAPFKIVVDTDGLPSEIWTKSGENVDALKVKVSVLKLLLQNATEIHNFLESGKTNVTNDKCQEVTKVSQADDEFIFKTTSKTLDCNGNALNKITSDKTRFQVTYHFSKSDEGLTRAKSVIDVAYLTTVAARFTTVQTMEFVSFDGLQGDIDESALTEKHTPQEIEKSFEDAH